MTEILPILALMAMTLIFASVVWWLHRMTKKRPDLKEAATAGLWIYPLFCIILFIPAVAMVHSGSDTWQNLATGAMPLIFFYPFSVFCVLGPYYRPLRQLAHKG